MNIFHRQAFQQKQKDEYYNNSMELVRSRIRLIHIRDDLSLRYLGAASILSYNAGLIISAFFTDNLLYRTISITIDVALNIKLIPKVYMDIKELKKKKCEEIIRINNLETAIKKI